MNLFRLESQPGWLCPQTYRRDPDADIICRQNADAAFDYSDGAAAEKHLHATFAGTQDRSTGSEALARGIHDWASAYHLSAQRADLLRPIADLCGGDTLEIGAGCGAITRFLGEQGGCVLALEGSMVRAKLARMRCEGLANVHVLVDNFQTAELRAPFDLVTLIGVLEYSPKYIAADDPVGFVLDRARALLKPGGALVIAIENQMGLKYLTGAPEDHHNVPYLGVEDRYHDLAVTFGRVELEATLQRRGFAHCDFYYPFGDYKLPSCIINQACADAADPFVDDLVRSFSRHAPAYLPAFSEEAATGVATRNGLLAHLANSFLVVARPTPPAAARDAVPRIWAYASNRAKPFAKQTLFSRQPAAPCEGDGANAGDRSVWHIARRRLYTALPLPDGTHVQMHLQDETALRGRLMYQAFLDIVNTPGWGATDLARWAQPWLGLLLAARDTPERASASVMLPGRCIDTVPHNVMFCDDGAVTAFDQEWSTTSPVAMGHVVLRGLGMVLTRPRSLATPVPGTPTRVLELAQQVMALLGLQFTEHDFAAYCAAEHAFQKASGGNPPEPRETLFYSAPLFVRPLPGARPRAVGGTQLGVEQQARLLRPVFDAAYYLDRYADVKQSGFDPLLHFIVHGDGENRDPCAWFSTRHYRRQHPDAEALGWSMLLHYVLLGKYQNRRVAGPMGAT